MKDEEHKDIKEKLSSLSQAKAPDDFLDKVHQRIEKRFDLLSSLKKVFSTPRPLRYAGAIATLLLFIGAYSYFKQGDMFTTIMEVKEEVVIKEAVPATTIKTTAVKTMRASIAPKQKMLAKAKKTQADMGIAAYEDTSTLKAASGAGSKAQFELAAVTEASPISIKLLLSVPSIDQAMEKTKEITTLVDGTVYRINNETKEILLNIPANNYERFMAELAKHYTFTVPAKDPQAKDIVFVTIQFTSK